MDARSTITTAKCASRSSDRPNSPDGGAWDGTKFPLYSPTENVWKGNMSAQSSIDFEGPLSPASSRMDALMDKSSALTTAYSAPSSCTDSWSNGHGDRDDPGEGDSDVPLDYLDRGPTATASVTVLKLEPTDDDINLDDVTTGPVPLDAAHGASEAKQKRPRGRPRKMLADTAIFTSKIMKGRSKTGCITCRRRKKKCDESKPRCMNCEKNAVLCEGYHEKQLWRSKRVKAEEGKFSILRCSSTQSSTTSLCPISDTDRLFAELVQQDSQPVITMQPIFHGVETVEDRILWKHYFTHLSNVLTVEGEAKNAFKDIILPLANEHQGLMHSILAVSSKHIDLDSPYGSRILNDNPTATRESLQHRGDFHHDEALNRLYKDLDTLANKDDPAYATVLAARYGQMLCLLLQTRAEGNPRGEHRVHLQAYQTLIQHSPPENEVFRSFITEFFQYHIFADDLLWYSGLGCSRLLSENLLRHVSVPKARLIGIGDGLFRCLSQITTLRNLIREKIAASREPIVDYTSLYRAAEIDAVIRDWIPRWPPGDSRHRVGPLYRQMMWVYLYRTIYPPLPWPPPRPTITTGPSNRDQSHMSDVQRRSSMVSMDSSVGSSAASNTMSPCRTEYGSHAVHSCSSSRNPSRTNSMHEIDWTPSIVERSQMPSEFLFPPLTTRSSHDDSRIKLAVEESLTIFESFSLSDPAQTLLLIPCIIIGTACFNVRQRERLRAVIKVIRGYTGLRNCDRLTELLEEVWSQMDKGEWMVAWDWQAIAKSLHLDFICA